MTFDIVVLIVSAMTAGTVISFASIGENFTELSGVYNVGTEGTMLLAAAASFSGALLTDNPYAGLFVGILVGAVIGIVQAAFAVNLRSDQIVFGLGLILLGVFGASFFVNQALKASNKQVFSAVPILPILDVNWLPSPFNVILEQSVLFFALLAIVYSERHILFKTKFGLAVRAVGENPHVAASTGISVPSFRYLCTVIGSAIAALGGVYLVLGLRGIWSDNLTGGRGFIGIAMVRAGLFRPVYILLVSMLFGLVDSFQLYFAASLGPKFPYQVLAMTPYLSGILVLFVSTRFKIFAEPAALGKPYFKE